MKKLMVFVFSGLCIVLALACVVLAITSALPADILLSGLFFGGVGAAMLTAGIRLSGKEKPPAAAKAEPKAEKQPQPAEPVPDPKPAREYPRDTTKPYGSKENPVVVGMPEYSDILVYDGKRDLWLLTDGLGNGWIR